MWHQSRKQPGFTGHLWMLVSVALFLSGQPDRSKCGREGCRLYGTWPSQACRQQGMLGSRGGKNSQQMDSNSVSFLEAQGHQAQAARPSPVEPRQTEPSAFYARSQQSTWPGSRLSPLSLPSGEEGRALHITPSCLHSGKQASSGQDHHMLEVSAGDFSRAEGQSSTSKSLILS